MKHLHIRVLISSIVISFVLYRPYRSSSFILAHIASQRALSWHLPPHYSCPRMRLCTDYRGRYGWLHRGRKCLISIFDCEYTQILFHVVCHCKSNNPQIIAVKDGGNIEFSILHGDFGDIRHTFLTAC